LSAVALGVGAAAVRVVLGRRESEGRVSWALVEVCGGVAVAVFGWLQRGDDISGWMRARKGVVEPPGTRATSPASIGAAVVW